MACGSCGRRAREQNFEFVWTDGETTVVYAREIVARQKVIRAGGSYTKRVKA